MDCDFCNENMKVPKNFFKIIYNKIKSKKNKKILFYFILLNVPYEKFKKFDIYIPFYDKLYLQDVRNQANEVYYDVGNIKCNFCEKTACSTHYLWSNFHNTKCIKCNKMISICGWCDKNDTCITCIENTNYPLYF